MYYNNAEAQQHQAVSHLGFTHLVEDGFVVVTHRQLSVSHPVFKLLAPHFLFTMAINRRAFQLLVSKGGLVDRGMTCQSPALFQILRNTLKKTPIMQYINIKNQIGNRGVLDKSVLPYYPYRDAAVPLYEAIYRYVRNYLNVYYADTSKLAADKEIKAWRDEIVLPRDKGGLGYDDVPGDNNRGFRNADELAELLTAIIATGSMGHGSAHLPMWDEYMFVPNYPILLNGRPPANKDERFMSEIMLALPKRMVMVNDIMFSIGVLTLNATNALSNYEMRYIYDPPAVNAFQNFQRELRQRSATLQASNKREKFAYPYLDPFKVANSIAI